MTQPEGSTIFVTMTELFCPCGWKLCSCNKDGTRPADSAQPRFLRCVNKECEQRERIFYAPVFQIADVNSRMTPTAILTQLPGE